MKRELVKTGKQWKDELYPQIKILDFDGFNRYNLNYSYEQELITEDEFQRRIGLCTIIVNDCPYPTQWFVDDGELDVTKHEC